MMARKRNNPDESRILKFFDRVAENPGPYCARFLMTLEINKAEAKHQRPDKPRVFIKTTDDLGVVEQYGINPCYLDSVAMPRYYFDADKIESLLRRMETDEQLLVNLRAMLECGELEFLTLTDDPDALPAVIKTCEPDGVVTAFMPNELAKPDRRKTPAN